GAVPGAGVLTSMPVWERLQPRAFTPSPAVAGGGRQPKPRVCRSGGSRELLPRPLRRLAMGIFGIRANRRHHSRPSPAVAAEEQRQKLAASAAPTEPAGGRGGAGRGREGRKRPHGTISRIHIFSWS